jgi:hypothetical protein
MERPRNHWRFVTSAALTGAAATATVAALAWPDLMRPEPPLEAAAGAGGVQIRLVEPPKAAVTRSEPLDVGLSDAAMAMAMVKGRQAPPPTFTSPPAPAPAETLPRLAVDDRPQPPARLAGPADDRWARERWIAQRNEARRQAQWERQQWERERWVAEDREERAALEQERVADQGWREARDDDDRYEPPPVDDPGPPPDRW